MPFPTQAPRRMLMLVGPPAAGKSTLMQHLTARWQSWPRPDAPVPHVLHLDHRHETQAIQLGILREHHPGTDALPHNVIERAITWLSTETAPPLLLIEGTRLAVNRWLIAAGQLDFHVLVALLDTDQDELDRRCAQRGSAQQPAWRQAMATRARNLHAWAQDRPHCSTLTLDATQPADTLSDQLWKELQ